MRWILPVCLLIATLAAAAQAPGPPPAPAPTPPRPAAASVPQGGPPAGARQGLPPGFPGPRANPTGTARIRGRVVSDNGLPVREADVRLSGNAVATLKSDDNGRFEFADLPRGNFTVDASKAGYAVPIVTDTGIPSDIPVMRTFAVADGQTVERTIMLTRGAVVRGRVVDEFGDPITDAEIRVERFVYGPGSSRQLVQHSSGSGVSLTDDRGEYRVFGVLPGEVLVSARSRQSGVSVTTGPVGRVDRGDTLLPTYFPNTLSLSEAQPIRVSAGREYTVDLAAIAGTLVRLSGTALGSDGKPAAGYRVTLIASGTYNEGGLTGADGFFAFSNVPPGDIQLQVRQNTTSPNVGESVSVPISLIQDINGLQVTIPRGATVRGSLLWDGTAPRPPTGSEFFLRSADPSHGSGAPRAIVTGAAPPVMREDGTFERHGVIGRVLFATNAPQWTVKSVSYNGRDVTDTGLDTSIVDDNGRVVIVMTDRISTVSGTVRDAQRRPVSDYVVVVLPEQPMEGMGATRWTKVAYPDRNGGFTVRTLPAGDYIAAAVADLESGQEWDPAVQKTLRAAGQRFTLSEGQASSLDLELGR